MGGMTKEKRANVELAPALVQAYSETFIPRRDMYPLQLPHGRYISVKEPLQPELVAQHLLGTLTLGAYALDQEDRAKWLCFDADDAPAWAQLRRLARELAQQDEPAYLEPSRRGGHLWLFLPPMAGQDARRLGRSYLQQYGLETLELFPKQDRLVTGPGSFVRLPLGIHQKTRRRYHFITLDGDPLAPTVRQQVALLANPARLSQALINDVLARVPPDPAAAPSPTFTSRDEDVAGATLAERLKNRISVYEFVSAYVALDERGVGLCPFHDDHHKSFGVNREGNYWHCWAGCGGGSLIDFMMKWRDAQGEDGSFTATITALAERLLP